MEELILVLGSVAGACTAVAMDRIPKRKNDKQVLRTSSTIKSQIQSLILEKEILTKTISRLYQNDSDLSKIHRDKLLLRYQNHLGLVISKIEKLETASKHPDLGPLGDGLVTLMDQKLSQLDQRLNEISSKITITLNPPQLTKKPETIDKVVYEKSQIKNNEIKVEIKPKEEQVTKPYFEIPIPENHKSVEITTLTEIPNKMPDFPLDLKKDNTISKQLSKEETVILPPQEDRTKNTEIQPVIEIPQPISEIQRTLSDKVPKSEQLQIPIEKKIQLPTALKIPEEEKLEEDDKDIDKIKNEIMKALSKLEQVEVE